MKKDLVLEFAFDVDYIDKETNLVKQRSEAISFIADADVMKISDFSGLEVYLYNLPLWAKVVLGSKPIEKIDPLDITDDLYINNWPQSRFAEYGNILIDMLSFFTFDNSGKSALARLRAKQISDIQDLQALANLFVQLYSLLIDRDYSERQYFEHKGREFVIPYDAQIIAKSLTWGEATEALQSDYMTGKPDADGLLKKELHLNNSLTIIASLCREISINDDDTFTEIQPPKVAQEWEKYLLDRKAFFADLPASVAMDVGFFLTNSYARKEAIPFLALLLSSPKFKETLRENPQPK